MFGRHLNTPLYSSDLRNDTIRMLNVLLCFTAKDKNEFIDADRGQVFVFPSSKQKFVLSTFYLFIIIILSLFFTFLKPYTATEMWLFGLTK